MARILTVSICLLAFFVASPVVAEPVASGLVLWLDAQDIDGDGNPANNQGDGTIVSTWADKATLQGTQNATQATAGLQPTYYGGVENGQAVVRFDGNDLLAAPSLAFGTFTYFTAMRGNSGSVLIYERSADSNSFDGEYLCATTNLTTNVRRLGGRSGDDLTSGWGANGQFRLTEHSYGGTDATHLLFNDGYPQSLISRIYGNPGTSSVTNDLYIGDRPGLGYGLKGDLAELLVYNRVLNENERIQVGRYLSAKFGHLETAYVPEPTSLVLLAIGGLGLLARRRRK